MHGKLRLFKIIGQAAFLSTIGGFLVTFALFELLVPPGIRFSPPPRVPSIGDAIILTASLVVPAALGFWWILRKLRDEYPRRQALGAAVAFAVFSPVALGLGLAVGPIVGGYTGIFLGTESRLVAFAGAVLGIVLVMALMTFVPCLLALWITRHKGGEVHQTQ